MSITPTRSQYRALGFPMERRRNRRRLVVVTYLALALVCGLAILFSRAASGAFAYPLYAALAVGIFVFGGQGRYGLVKAFLNKPPRPEPPLADLIRLQLAPLSVGTPPEASWRNDERELAQRDRAHYTAYQPLAVAVVVVLLLSSWSVHPPRWLPLPVALDLTLSLALIASVLALTLPSALILWNEPDLD